MRDEVDKLDFCPFSREWLLHIERVNKKRQGEFYRAIIDYLTGYEPEINSLDVKTFEILKPQLDRVKNRKRKQFYRDNQAPQAQGNPKQERPPRPSVHHIWSEAQQQWVYSI